MDSTEGDKGNLSYHMQRELFSDENLKKYGFLREIIKQETGGYMPSNVIAWFICQAEDFNDGQPLSVDRLQKTLEHSQLPDINIDKIDINDPQFKEYNRIQIALVMATGIIRLKSSNNPQIQVMVEDLERQALDLWRVKNQEERTWKALERSLSEGRPGESDSSEANVAQNTKVAQPVEIIIDFSKTTTDNLLGWGAMGEVWKGSILGGLAALRGERVDNPQLETVVVKIPSTRLGHIELPRQVASLEKEYKILHLLRKKGTELFPNSPSHFCDVEVTNVKGQTALVMEFLDVHNTLYNHSGDNYSRGECFTPIQFQSAINQYFQVLEIVHSLGFTCNDRKELDIYYFPGEDRLVVLDWGTLHIEAGRKGTESYRDLAVDNDGLKAHERKRMVDFVLGLHFFSSVYQRLLKLQPATAGFSATILETLKVARDRLDRMSSATISPSTEAMIEFVQNIGKIAPEDVARVLKL